jgi:hypothetical protein
MKAPPDLEIKSSILPAVSAECVYVNLEIN